MAFRTEQSVRIIVRRWPHFRGVRKAGFYCSRVSTQKNEVFQNFSKLVERRCSWTNTNSHSRGHAPMFICRDIETLIILQILAKFAKTWGTIVIQHGKRFLMESLDEDDRFSKVATINHRLEHINHLARQFRQKMPIFCISM